MSNTPWVDHPEIWKTESSFLSWIRGGIRRSLWNRSPIKLEFIKRNRIKIPNPNPKGKVAEVWGATCALTGVTLPLKDMEVDHKEGNHSLRTLDDIKSFIEGIVLVSLDDLQWVSKEAHKVKSYCEKQGISFEEALIEKKAIAAMKMKAPEQRRTLLEHGFSERDIKTVGDRRSCFVELYRREYDAKNIHQ